MRHTLLSALCKGRFSFACTILLTLFATCNLAWSQGRNTGNAGTAVTTGPVGAAQQQGIDLSAGSSENIEREFNSGFVGGSDNAGRFIGNETAGQQSFNRQGIPNFQRAQQNQANQSRKAAISPIRYQARIGFQFPRRNTKSLTTGLNAELFRLQALKPGYQSVRLTRRDNGVLVLTGSVPTTQARKLVEIYLNLEPGVKSIHNELRVIANETNTGQLSNSMLIIK